MNITSKRIKELREERKLSYQTLGDALGVSKSTVFRWESGETDKVSRSTIQALSIYFKVNPLYILGVSDDKEEVSMDANVINNMIGKNISDLLVKHKMSAADLARMLNVSRSTVSCWISGTKVPRMDKVEKMCAVFSCNRNSILSDVTTESLDALEEDIIKRFRQLTNTQKISIYKSFDKLLRDMEEANNG